MNPTTAQLTAYLINDNGWTAEEVDQLLGYYFRNVNADGTTTLTRDQWSILAMGF